MSAPLPTEAPAPITVHRARAILTMDPNRPRATHVAVQGGRILAVGGPDCADPWGGGRADDSLASDVILPGFVEAHSHLMAGAMWRYAYAGFHDRTDPDGRFWPGLTDTESVIEGLRARAADLPPGQPLVAWGFDPIHLAGERLHRGHLDRVAADRPVVVMHQSFHLMTVNSAALDIAGYGPDTDVPGVVMQNGAPAGELQEMAAMFPVMRRLELDWRALSRGPEGLHAFARAALRAGVTTATDLYSTLEEPEVDAMIATVSDPAFPIRVVPALASLAAPMDQMVARAVRLKARSVDKLRFGAVKIMTDGSIQGFSARIKWPPYLNGVQNGLWNTPPDQIFQLAEAVHAAGLQMHCHVNGDEASEVMIDALAAAIAKHPRPDHRHCLQHGQMIGADQFRRMKALGLTANLFANHIFFYGDRHVDSSIGPDRAARMDACRSCLDEGVPLTIHSDAPVTPMSPLTVAWCAVNRLTGSGKVLGPEQRISVPEALRAITLGAAHTLHLDAEIGSIETGKRADFALLSEDPTEVAPEALRDIEVRGTVLGGRVFRP